MISMEQLLQHSKVIMFTECNCGFLMLFKVNRNFSPKRNYLIFVMIKCCVFFFFCSKN
jgi:hypothetical protein